MGIFRIPGNIKQEIIPFVLNPTAEINSYYGASNEIKGTAPQYFTYRNNDKGKEGGKGILNLFPSTFQNLNLAQDLSYQMLYKLQEDGIFKADKQVKLTDLLNFIPGVQIREYIPDTKLDQTLNFFINIFQKIKDIFGKDSKGSGGSSGGGGGGSGSGSGSGGGSSTSGGGGSTVAGASGSGSANVGANVGESSDPSESYADDSRSAQYEDSGVAAQDNTNAAAAASQPLPSPEASTFDKIVGTVRFAIKYMLGDIVDNNLPDNLSKEFEKVDQADYGVYNMSNDHARYVLRFPWNLYYNLQSCVTTNIYEIPAITSSRRIANSEGMAGWTGGGSTGLRVSKLFDASSIPLVGGMINGILGNVAIDYLPWWNSEAGSAVKEPEITIEFDLFNDSDQAAMINFIFVNTIIPHNRWVQYHLFQHSPAIYDVKIEGINRLFACAGAFDVTYQGVLRDPPVKWLEELCKKHANCKKGAIVSSDNLLNELKTKKMIKIPDIYHVTMKFQSLVPANFNNLMYSFAMNGNLIDERKRYGFHNGEAWRGLEKEGLSFFDSLKKVWDNGGDYRKAGFMDSEDKAAQDAADKEAAQRIEDMEDWNAEEEEIRKASESGQSSQNNQPNNDNSSNNDFEIPSDNPDYYS